MVRTASAGGSAFGFRYTETDELLTAAGAEVVDFGPLRELEERPMIGAIDATATITGRLTLRYREATAAQDSLRARAGEPVTGHEFHRTELLPEHGAPT